MHIRSALGRVSPHSSSRECASVDFLAMMGSGDQAVARIAAGQRTLVTTAQLAECGLGKDAVAYRVHKRRLHPVFRTVYSVGCGQLPPLALELAALLACGERTFLSHRSSAFVRGMLKTPPPAVEVSVVGRCCASRKGLRVHRIRTIDRRELERHEGLWISTPARAVLEVAEGASRNEIIDLVDEGVENRACSRRQSSRR